MSQQNISSLSINVGMYLEAEQVVQEAKRVNDATNSVIDTTQKLSGVVGPVDSAMRSHVDNYERMQTVLENTGLRLNDLTRQMSGLYQAQARLAGGRKEMQAAFDDRLDIKVAATLQPPEKKNSGELASRLAKQQALVAAMRAEYDQLAASIANAGDKRAEVLQLERQLSNVQRQKKQVASGPDEVARLAALEQDVTNKLAARRAEVQNIEAVETRLFALKSRGGKLEAATLTTAKQLVDARGREAQAAQKLADAQSKIADAIAKSRDAQTMAREAFENAFTAPVEVQPKTSAEAATALQETLQLLQLSEATQQQINGQLDKHLQLGLSVDQYQNQLNKEIAYEAELRAKAMTLQQQAVRLTEAESQAAQKLVDSQAKIADAIANSRAAQAAARDAFENTFTAPVEVQPKTSSEANAALRETFQLLAISEQAQREINADLDEYLQLGLSVEDHQKQLNKEIAYESELRTRAHSLQNRVVTLVESEANATNKIIQAIRDQNQAHQNNVNAVDSEVNAFTQLLRQADAFNKKVQLAFSGESRSSDELALEFYDAATALDAAKERAAALETEIVKGKAANRDMSAEAAKLKAELSNIYNLQSQLPQLASQYSNVLKTETRELQQHEDTILRTNQAREKGVKAVQREAMAAARAARARETNATAPSRGELSSRTSDELRAMQQDINNEIAEANDLLQQQFQWRAQLIKAGQDEEASIRNIDDLKSEVADLDKRRADISAAVSNATRREEQALSNVQLLMSKLGSTDSARAQVQARINNNAAEFNRNLQQAIRSGQIMENQAEELRAEFARINTEANVARQLSLNAGTNNFGFAVTQFSYGLEDFVSQIERGVIPALSGAANNVNTIAQSLGGPYVALFTTATIASFQIAKAVGFFGDQTESAQQQLDNFVDSSDYLIEKLEAIRDLTEMRIDIGWATELDDLTGQFTDFSDDIMALSRDRAKLLREMRIKDLAEQKASLDTATSYMDRFFMGMRKLGGYSFDDDTAAREKVRKQRMRELEAEENALGVHLSEEERQRREINLQITEKLKMMQQASAKAAEAGQALSMESMGLKAEDLRDIQAVRQELIDSSDQQAAKAAELVAITAKYETLSKNLAVTAEGRDAQEAERIKLQERALELTGEINQLSEKQVENAKRAQEMMKENVEARQKLREIIEGYGSEEEQKMLKVRDAVAEIVEQAELLAQTGAGDRFADAFEAVMDGVMDGLEAQRAEQQLELNGPDLTTYQQEQKALKETAALRAKLAQLNQQANNDPSNKAVAEQRIATAETLIEKEKELWEAQKARIQQNTEAHQSLQSLVTGFGTDEEQQLAKVHETVQQIAQDAREFAEGNPGVHAAEVFEATVAGVLDGLERQRMAVEENGDLQITWADRIADSVAEYAQLEAERIQLAQQAANDPNNAVLAAAQITNAEKLLEAEQTLADARADARDAVNDANQMVQAHIGQLDREFAVTSKIKDEREKLNQAIKAGLATGELSQREAKKLKSNFERIVKAQERYTAAEERRKELDDQFGRVSSEFDRLNSMPNQSVSIATRGSAEAQQIMDRVFREGLKRNAQDPQIKAMVDILNAINTQTDIMQNQQNIAQAIGLTF